MAPPIDPIHPDFQPLVYVPSDWSRIEWRFYKDQDSHAESVIYDGEAKLPGFRSFAAEVFSRLYGSPQRLPDAEIMPEAQWAVKAHAQLEKDFVPDFQLLVQQCQGDNFLAGTATVAFLEVVAAQLPDPSVPLQDVPELRRQVQAWYDLFSIQDSSQESQLPPDVQQEINQLRQQGKASVEGFIQYALALDESDLRNTFRQACDEAHNAIVYIRRQMDAFGWGSDAHGFNPKKMGGSLEDKLALAKRFRKSWKLQRIAENAGRLIMRAARKQRGKTDQVKTQIAGIETGNDLMNVLDEEIAKMVIPQLQPLFAMDYINQTLLQYKMTGEETEVRGPLCVAIDSSTSMGEGEGLKEIWAKAAAIALLSIAAQQKRDFWVIHFNKQVQQTDEFPAGDVDPQRLLQSMESFYGGGTSWEAPLDACVEAIAKKPNLKQADIVLITDGICSVSEDWRTEYRRQQQELGFTTWGILIGFHDPEKLKLVADKIVVLPDVQNDAALDDVFAI